MVVVRIFISHASDDAEVAGRVAASLANDDHDVFLSATSLSAGDAFDGPIRDAIAAADLMVVLLSEAFTRSGRYTLTELELAKQRWAAPSGHVMPVALDALEVMKLDPYLRSVTVLEPVGDVAAEIASAVEQLRDPRTEELAAAIASGRSGSVAEQLDSLVSEKPLDPEANLLAAFVALGDQQVRLLDSATVRDIEDHLILALADESFDADAVRLLAILRRDYYAGNGVAQPPPTLAQLEEALPGLPPSSIPDLFAHVRCSDAARSLVLTERRKRHV